MLKDKYQRELGSSSLEFTQRIGHLSPLSFIALQLTPTVTNQGSWPSPVNRNWLEARQEIQARLYWGSYCCRRGWGEQKQVTSSLVRSPRWGKLVPYMGWGQWCVQWSGRRGGLGSLPTPLVVWCAGGMLSTLLFLPTPVFAPSSSEVAVGFFGLFVSLCS